MKKLLIFLTLSFLTLNACENVFEITPQDKISETDVWTDPILVRSFMNAIYTQTFGQGLYRDTQLGGATDEIHSIKNAGNYYIIQRGELTSDNISSIHAYLNNWPSVYKLIRETNIFFSKIQAATFDEITKNQMIAEMKFINAFLYAKLIERYGGVPIITQVFGLGENDYSLTRDSYDDCVNHIVNQLDEVINALPKKQTGTSLGKISADAARALKARVLLYAASPLFNPTNDLLKWQKAADAAKVLINNGYSLHNNYQQLFMQDNNEIIFARFFTQANFHQINVQAGRNGNDGYGSDTPTQNLIDGYEMAA
ncbi:MAG: RagB/SusD family nutrient uptake outer membrane protein, partial [Bacteroidales bacterium]|nr:RagB/SusD family nutrient uptake outer membrane protein [Bacteroidales bacterium]